MGDENKGKSAGYTVKKLLLFTGVALGGPIVYYGWAEVYRTALHSVSSLTGPQAQDAAALAVDPTAPQAAATMPQAVVGPAVRW